MYRIYEVHASLDFIVTFGSVRSVIVPGPLTLTLLMDDGSTRVANYVSGT